jgi:hypothetical protein
MLTRYQKTAPASYAYNVLTFSSLTSAFLGVMSAQAMYSTAIIILVCFAAFKILPRYTVALLSSEKQPQRQSDSLRHTIPAGVEVRQIYPGVDEAIETEFDIIAIHGLDTKSPDTWIWRNPGDANSIGVNWLSDLLPRNFPKARVFTCDWPANLFKRSDTIETTTKELARSLLLAIEARQHDSEDRPIIFIASCLGGVVLAQALILAAASRSEYPNLWKATTGIVFLATPFRGTAFKQIARQSVFFLKGFAMLSGRRVTTLLDSVGHSTAFLEELVGSFTRICLERGDTCQLSVLYETGRGNLWRKLLPSPIADILFKQQAVREDSFIVESIVNKCNCYKTHTDLS